MLSDTHREGKPLLTVTVPHGIGERSGEEIGLIERRIPQGQIEVLHHAIDSLRLGFGDVASEPPNRRGERHVHVDCLAVEQCRQGMHLDCRAEGVPVVDAAFQSGLPQIRLQFFEHEVDRLGDDRRRGGFQFGCAALEVVVPHGPSRDFEGFEQLGGLHQCDLEDLGESVA